MQSELVPILICAAFCIPSGVAIGFAIAGLFVRRQIHTASHRAYMDAVRHYQAEALQGRR
jgi:hypothetical protein